MTDLYERQREIEYDCVVLGKSRYEKARLSNGDSGTKPGFEQTRAVLPLLAKAIGEFVEVAAKPGRAGRKHTALPYLLHVEPEQAAYLTIRYVLDAAATGKALSTIAREVGEAIQDHLNILALSDQAPGLYRKVMEQLKTSTAARHRMGVLRHVAKKYKIETLSWSIKDKVTLGVKLIELLEASTTLIEVREVRTSPTRSRVRVRFTPEAQEWFTNRHDLFAEFAPVHMPMVVPPRNWTSPFHGGYLTDAIRGVTMIQSHSPGYLDETRNVDMPEVYDAVNIAQATAWKINRAVYGVMLQARALSGERFQSLFVEPDCILPLRPTEVPPDVPVESLSLEHREILLSWRRATAECYTRNVSLSGKRAVIAKQLWVVEQYMDHDAIYFPHYLDFRGRLYPFSSYLGPQKDDAARALLEFANGKPLGARGAFWLKVHIANQFGVDKVSFEERAAWTEAHHELLLDSAFNPLDGSMFWATADNTNEGKGRNADGSVEGAVDGPWQALAACFEYAGYCIQGETYVSHLPIAMDGSCSGLQHYSAMLRDPIGGAAVNLIPADQPGDIYSAVARRAQAIVDSSHEGMSAVWKGGKVVRKIAKQPTMTICYSATVYGMQGQIKRAIETLGGTSYINGETTQDAAKYLAPIIWAAIGDTVVAARDAMEFLKELAKAAAAAGLPIRWTSPLGFPVVQEYREPKENVVCVYYGGQEMQLTLTRAGTRLNKRRQAAGVAPNFVHSLDAAHLMSTVVLGYDNDLRDWAVVHDSFGVHATDVDTLHACVRETFIEQYTPDVLARLHAEVGAQLQANGAELPENFPAVPLPGSLDLAAVRESAYFFA